MKFFYIRHAQSSNNHLYLSQGSWRGRNDDPELTELGRRQAARLAEFLAGSDYGFTHLYSSLHLRALQTGQVAGAALGLPLNAWPDWHESGGIYQFDPEAMNSGLPESELPRLGLPGKPRTYYEKHFPDLRLPADIGEGGWWQRPFEEKPLRSLRARRVLAELKARHGDKPDRVAVISHGSFYNYFVRAVMGLSEIGAPGYSGEVWFTHYNCGLTCLDFGESDAASTDAHPGEVQVVFQNRHDYLLPDLISR